ncbi:MAG TPA: hypothetical protein VEK76_09675 [Candidatus Binatia bacterium]|nr:hypothetical protein [Candidatus Binatia bacterium]
MTRIGNLLRTVWKARPSLVWVAGSGRWCRVCGQEIGWDDGFGLSEGVCSACRCDPTI